MFWKSNQYIVDPLFLLTSMFFHDVSSHMIFFSPKMIISKNLHIQYYNKLQRNSLCGHLYLDAFLKGEDYALEFFLLYIVESLFQFSYRSLDILISVFWQSHVFKQYALF